MEKVVQLVEQAIEPEPPSRSIDQAAKIVGVNKQYVQDMKTIAKEEPELVEKIKAGEVVRPLYAKQPLPGFPVRLLS